MLAACVTTVHAHKNVQHNPGTTLPLGANLQPIFNQNLNKLDKFCLLIKSIALLHLISSVYFYE